MSDEKEPVAWYVTGDGWEYSTLLEEHARAVAEEEDGTVTPLYQLPTLTAEEREAVEWAAALEPEPNGRWTKANDETWNKRAATLHGILKRLD
jgi:hypothetical protein